MQLKVQISGAPEVQVQVQISVALVYDLSGMGSAAKRNKSPANIGLRLIKTHKTLQHDKVAVTLPEVLEDDDDDDYI